MQRNSHPFGKENENAHLSKIDQDPNVMALMLSWTKNPTNLLYFCGNVGNGKSYFASAWYNHLIESRKHVRAFSEHDLFGKLMSIMKDNHEPHFELERLCDVQYFILDDMGSSKSSEWKDEMLLHFLNLRFGMPTLITSNLKESQLLENHHPRFVSRIYNSKNTIIELNLSDRRRS